MMNDEPRNITDSLKPPSEVYGDSAEIPDGKWKATADLAEIHPDDIRVCRMNEDDQCVECIALVGQMGETDESDEWTQETLDRWWAYAQMMAAAPDLLAAAKKLRTRLKHADPWVVPSDAANDLNAAIAKAEGRTDE